MAILNRAFIDNTDTRVHSLQQTPYGWYENPLSAYIPVIGIFTSSVAQFHLNGRLDELGQAVEDIRRRQFALQLEQRAIEHCDIMGRYVATIVQPTQSPIYPEQNKEIAPLRKKVEELQKATPQIAAKARKLIDASNHQAIVAIIQGLLLSILAISSVALGILNPAIGVPLFMVCAGVIAGHTGALAQNYLENAPKFKLRE